MDGVLNIDKPSGMTSHDVVDRIRKLVGQKRIGHTGTLDPSATGVLVLCLGKATRIAQYLEAGEKEYIAVMQLGVVTDTLDADGKIIESRSYSPPDRALILNVIQTFTGTILQTPPVYSAVKIGGVPSYKLARTGKAQPLKPREVTIHSIELSLYEDPFLTMKIRCSKGVYIRTLCADIGSSLGMGACLKNLIRTRSGRFTIENASKLEALEELQNSDVGSILISMDEALEDLSSIIMNDNDSQKIVHGSSITGLDSGHHAENALVRMHSRTGRFLALARNTGGLMRPEVVFSDDPQ